MAKYRHDLPQLSGELFLTDGGLETTLVFHEGLELPDFAAFALLDHDQGRETLRRYFQPYIAIARSRQVGFILESATWRASPDWGDRLGYSGAALAALNRRAIAMLSEIRAEHETDHTRMVISGCIGPRGDGYSPSAMMSAEQAQRYHETQAKIFGWTEADMVTAITMTYAEEAIGVTRAARAAGMPVAISFTVETDGTLPSGQALPEAVQQVDEATAGAPAYYMINCAHPTHFAHVFDGDAAWVNRIRGIRANASTKSHAELDEAEELDAGNPEELGAQYRQLRDVLGHVNVLGGCCGTDHRHIEAVSKACILH